MSIEQNLSQLCNVSSYKKNEQLFIYLTGSFSLKNLNEFTDLMLQQKQIGNQ